MERLENQRYWETLYCVFKANEKPKSRFHDKTGLIKITLIPVLVLLAFTLKDSGLLVYCSRNKLWVLWLQNHIYSTEKLSFPVLLSLFFLILRPVSLEISSLLILIITHYIARSSKECSDKPGAGVQASYVSKQSISFTSLK